MHLSGSRWYQRTVRQSLLAICLTAACLHSVQAAPPSNTAIAIVAEMQRPPGIKAGKSAEIRRIAGDARGEQGVTQLRDFIKQQWQQVRALDVVAMSRYHVEATRGWQMPAMPGELKGRIIAAEADDSAFYLELVGPRLPASFDIVHRHLTFYARYQPASGKLDRITATIRLEVLE